MHGIFWQQKQETKLKQNNETDTSVTQLAIYLIYNYAMNHDLHMVCFHENNEICIKNREKNTYILYQANLKCPKIVNNKFLTFKQ